MKETAPAICAAQQYRIVKYTILILAAHASLPFPMVPPLSFPNILWCQKSLPLVLPPLDALILIYRKQAEPHSINHGKTYEAVSVRTVFFTVRHCYVLHFVQTVFLMMMEWGSACLCLSAN